MIRLIADSTCDLSPELIERYQISILPLNVILGEETFVDGKTITPEELFAWSDRTEKTPKTSVFSEVDAMRLFRTFLDSGDELLCFSISDSMSASGQVMRLAAKELHSEDRIHIIDSANLSTGIGLLVLKAADLIEEGHSAAEILSMLEEIKPLVRSSFVIDTLTYLHRGGRCSGMTAMIGNVLKLHPSIFVRDGKMDVGKKYHSSMRHVLRRYEEDLEPELLHAESKRVFITHTCRNDEWVQEIRQKLEDLHYFEEILITRAGSVVSCHCGPNTLGILYIDQKGTGQP